ncbi:hypothetical protein M413DRAFT_322033 [Hebeloma cylindrosporum]|uniref:Uncharacterized protein n=1 Tax=Hebeloma cylindrosporum TaxID=76867 RepID=A0A0C3BHB4_HEBCY|nr:hypothetical protein M413DRAFT_322033 [Hebeloma cylindrosporum h7]
MQLGFNFNPYELRNVSRLRFYIFVHHHHRVANTGICHLRPESLTVVNDIHRIELEGTWFRTMCGAGIRGLCPRLLAVFCPFNEVARCVPQRVFDSTSICSFKTHCGSV